MVHKIDRARASARRPLHYAAVLLAMTACSAYAQEWKPERNVEIVVSSGAGGAADRSARVIQKYLQSVPGMPSVTVNNKPGGSGTLAWSSLNLHPGDAHYISTLNTALVTNQIMGLSTLRYQDITPLNIVMHEYVAVWVRTASGIQNGKDLVAKLKADPGSVSFGISPARGNQNHIVLGMIARAAGIDPKALKIVVYSSGGAGTTALVSKRHGRSGIYIELNPEYARMAQDRIAQDFVPTHAWWVWRKRSFGSSANNHLIGELTALVMVTKRLLAATSRFTTLV